MTETILIQPHVTSSFPVDRRRVVESLNLPTDNVVVEPVQLPNRKNNAQWYFLTLDRSEEVNLDEKHEYNKYDVINTSGKLDEYRHHLAELFEEVIDENPYTKVFVTINSMNRKLSVEVKKFDAEKNKTLTVGEFTVALGREGFNDFDEEDKKPKSLTVVKNIFNGRTEDESGYLNYIEGYRIDNEFQFFLERLKNKLFTKDKEPEHAKLKLTHEQLNELFKSTHS